MTSGSSSEHSTDRIARVDAHALRAHFRRPAPLRPGDAIAVIAPSGPIPREDFEPGARLLGEHYRLVYTDELYAREGFLAGSDARRLAELEAALTDDRVRAIWCARGGHGALRLLPRLAPERLAALDKPFIGFSDVTALHAGFSRAGVATVHGPVITQLARIAAEHPGALPSLFRFLESSAPAPSWTGLRTLGPGRAEGHVVGGNLEVLTRLLGTPYFPSLDGAVLFVEEVGEAPYRLDRQLAHLALAGALHGLVAVVIGELTRCEAPASTVDPVPALDVFARALAPFRIPVAAAAPFGHGSQNRPFWLGGRVRLDADAGTLRFLSADAAEAVGPSGTLL